MPFIRANEVFGKRTSPEFFDEFRPKQLTCRACDESIKESVTGCRKWGDGTYSCSDCYYEHMGKALEAFPIAPRRFMRRA